MSQARLTRSETDRMIAGVCGGIAAYLDIDPVLVRLAFVLLLFASGIGFPLYLILWIVMPSEAAPDVHDGDVLQKNMSELSDSVYSSVNRLGRPGTIGVVLILLGVYFLLNQMGWVSGAIFWPIVIIGLGLFVLVRRNR